MWNLSRIQATQSHNVAGSARPPRRSHCEFVANAAEDEAEDKAEEAEEAEDEAEAEFNAEEGSSSIALSWTSCWPR